MGLLLSRPQISLIRIAAVRHLWAAAALMMISAQLNAQTIELRLESVAGGPPVSGAGTPTGSMDTGTVSAFESVSSSVTRSTGSSSFTISAQFGVRVIRNSGTSANYTLQCRLQSSQSLNWTVNDVTVSTSFATVAILQPYDSTQTHTVSFAVPFSSSDGGVAADFELIAIAN